MRNRIEKFYDALIVEGLTPSEIAAGLQNGDIKKPEWMSSEENTDNMKIWDHEDGGSQYLGFMTLEY